MRSRLCRAWLEALKRRRKTVAVASIILLLGISQISSLGSGTGIALSGLTQGPTQLSADTYWATLAVTVLVIAGIYGLLRSRLGLVLTAIRDNETGARSIGGRVASVQRLQQADADGKKGIAAAEKARALYAAAQRQPPPPV